MNNHGNYSRKARSGKYNPIPNYTPLLGVKMYVSESKFLLTFMASVAYMLIHARMALIEQSAAGGILCILGIAASFLLAVGAMFLVIGASIRRSPGIIAFSGLTLLLISFSTFCVTVALELLYEGSILGVIQGLFELLMLVGLIIIVFTLILSCLNKRTAPSASYLAAVSAVFALILLLVRTLTTFASLTSALGTDFSWEGAADLASEIRWALKTVETTSIYASQMYYARMFERAALLLLITSALSPVFKFAPFFRQYNMQMEITHDIPANRAYFEQLELERRREKEERGALSGLRGLRSLKKDPQPEPPLKTENEPEKYNPIRGYCGPDFIEGFDLFDERVDAPSVQPVRRPIKQPDSHTVEPDIMAPMVDDFIIQPVSDNMPERNAETGAYKVKLSRAKPSIPRPDDESIWFHYTDDGEDQ